MKIKMTIMWLDFNNMVPENQLFASSLKGEIDFLRTLQRQEQTKKINLQFISAPKFILILLSLTNILT